MCYKNVGTIFFRFVTIYAFDRRTDGRTERLCDTVQLEAVRRRISRSRLFFGKFCNAHEHKLLFSSFRSKF